MVKIIRVATAIIERQKKILLLQRSTANKHFVGYWQLPEGKLESDETPEQALKRELHEELGCVLINMIYLGTDITSLTVSGTNTSVERTIFKVTIRGELHLSDEHATSQWVSAPFTSIRQFYPGTIPILNLYRAPINL